MTSEQIGIEIHNEEELLRVYENNVKNAKNDTEKARWDKAVSHAKAEISNLQSSAK